MTDSKAIKQYKAETGRIKAIAAQTKAEEKLESTQLKSSKYNEKAKEKENKSLKALKKQLGKRLRKTKRVLRKKQLHVNIPVTMGRNAPYIPTFMAHQIEQEKRSMFFS